MLLLPIPKITRCFITGLDTEKLILLFENLVLSIFDYCSVVSSWKIDQKFLRFIEIKYAYV